MIVLCGASNAKVTELELAGIVTELGATNSLGLELDRSATTGWVITVERLRVAATVCPRVIWALPGERTKPGKSVFATSTCGVGIWELAALAVTVTKASGPGKPSSSTVALKGADAALAGIVTLGGTC